MLYLDFTVTAERYIAKKQHGQPGTQNLDSKFTTLSTQLIKLLLLEYSFFIPFVHKTWQESSESSSITRALL